VDENVVGITVECRLIADVVDVFAPTAEVEAAIWQFASRQAA
jgi:hypothetical protein